MNNFSDVTVVGGGAAGIMAALSCRQHHPDFTVAILDHSFELGRKLLVSGGGRCNLTNVHLDDLEKGFAGNDLDFISKVFKPFDYRNITKFFNDLGVEFFTEDKNGFGKVFPLSRDSKSVLAVLKEQLKALNVKIFLETDVKTITRQENGFSITCNSTRNDKQREEFTSRFVILATGGKTYPALGSDGSGYVLASALGHKIRVVVPAAVPLVAKDFLIHKLQGVRMMVTATSIVNGEKVRSCTDELIFTNYGLSGSAVLDISRDISIHINRNHGSNAYVSINLLPAITPIKIRSYLEERFKRNPKQTIELNLLGLFNQKFVNAFLASIKIDKDKVVSNLSNGEIAKLSRCLFDLRFKINATRGWNEGEFTSGGVETCEINGTLESKKVKGLYLCGEMINVDGKIGGFNLSWAWSSGWVAGKLE